MTSTGRNDDHGRKRHTQSATKTTWPITNIGKHKRVMVFGDSNAFRPDGGPDSWPGLLEDKDTLFLKVFNESCDGRTTNFDNGEYKGISVIGKKLDAHAPLDYVIVMLGTNDVKNTYGPPNTTEIVDGMSQILVLIDAHECGGKPILLTPPPMGNVNSGDLAGGQSRIATVAAQYRLLAVRRGVELIDIQEMLETTRDLESDMVHINVVGREKIANAVWANLQD